MDNDTIRALMERLDDGLSQIAVLTEICALLISELAYRTPDPSSSLGGMTAFLHGLEERTAPKPAEEPNAHTEMMRALHLHRMKHREDLLSMAEMMLQERRLFEAAQPPHR